MARTSKLAAFIGFTITLLWTLLLYSQSPTQVGYLILDADSSTRVPIGTVLFSYTNTDGVLVSEAGVGSAEPMRTGRIFVEEEATQTTRTTQTAVALVNTSDQAASVGLVLRDASGNAVNCQSQALSARQHLSKFVRDLCPNLPLQFLGSLTFESDRMLVALTLRQNSNSRGEPLYATLPVVDPSVHSNDRVVFPDVAAGDGYVTQLVLINRSRGRIRGQVRLTASDGSELRLQVSGTTVSEFLYEIEPDGVYRAELESPSGLSAGYAMLSPEAGSETPAGAAIFQYKPAGQIITEAGVAATTPTTSARIFVDQAADGSRRTGLAIANPGGDKANLTLILMDRYGENAQTMPLTIPPGGHVAKFVDELFMNVTEGFTGLLEMRSTAAVAPITLRVTTNTRHETILTTLPVADLMRAATTTTLIFPHFAFGSEFKTRLILINTDTTGTASGRIRFYREDGGPLQTPMGGGQSAQFNYQLSSGSVRQFLPGNAATARSIVLLNSSDRPITELTINEGSRRRPRLRILDSDDASRDDFDVSYSSSAPDVAGVDNGWVVGKMRGWSTLSISAGSQPGGPRKDVPVTIVGIDSGDGGYRFSGIVQAPDLGVYLAATDLHTIVHKKSVTEAQAPETYAGIPQRPGLNNDVRLLSQFRSPAFLAVSPYDRNLYVSDAANNVIRIIRAGTTGRVETYGDATFSNPQGIARDTLGRLWVADSANHTIRRINLDLSVDTVAGEAGSPGFTDGIGPAARFRSPVGIAIEPQSAVSQLQGRSPVRLLVVDAGNGAIRRVYEEDGHVVTLSSALPSGAPVASQFQNRKFGFQNPVGAQPLRFSNPFGVAADSFGTIYVTQPDSKEVDAILPNGDVVAAAEEGTFNSPRGIVVSQSSGFVVADRRPQQIHYGEPEITRISPDHISVRGKVNVTIQGRNFAPGSVIVAGDVEISNIDSMNTETISFTAPQLASGKITLTVLNRGGLAQTALLVEAVPLDELATGYITTVAGGSTFAGDGARGTAAPLTPSTIALDATGNLFIADSFNNRIRRVDAGTGIITTVAGNGGSRYNGDGGLAITTSLNNPLGIAFDRAGNLFIADSYNEQVRRVDAGTGRIKAVAGTGRDGSDGDGGPATKAELNLPTGLALDEAGNLFIADTLNNRIRRVGTNGYITTVAGGDGSLYRPDALFFDSAGNLFFTDSGNNRIKKIDTNGVIMTVVGNGGNGFSDDFTPALNAQLANPAGVTVDVDGNLYFSDTFNGLVRKLTAGNFLTTVAGNRDRDPTLFVDGRPAKETALRQPRAIAIDARGNLFIADLGNHRVRRVDGKTGFISTVAGNGDEVFLGDNGPATSAVLNYPRALAFDALGNLFVADSYNRIRKIDASTKLITTVIAGLSFPSGIAFDPDGNLYVADTGNHLVRKVDARTNRMTTIAGTGKQGFSDGGSATSAALNGPEALAADDRGNLFIADSGNGRIRQVDLANHTISTFAAVPNIADMILDRAGNLLISHFEDSENGRILRADTVTRSITIVADGRSVSPVDKNARLLPTAMVFDGRLFFMELYREVILKMDASNLLTTAAGNGRSAFSGDNGPAVMASLRYPRAMAFDRSRNLFIADSENNRIRVIRGSIP